MQMNASSIVNQKAEWEKLGVKLPAFDHAAMTAATKEHPIWVHFGAGNIFRGFIAALQQRLLNEGVADRGIIAADTFDYDIIDKTSNASVASGTFMQMNASDGPHYGANVKLDKAGAYKLVLKIESPEKKGWMLHVDSETGVKGRFWTEPIEVTFPDWNYTPQEW